MAEKKSKTNSINTLLTPSHGPDKQSKSNIQKWREYAENIQSDASNNILGQEKAIRLIIISLFARGHVLLEGRGRSWKNHSFTNYHKTNWRRI